MAEHVDILLIITGTLFSLIFALIAWQGNRQIRRIDSLEIRMVEIEQNTNEAVNNIKNNYVKEFKEVRACIAELKEANAIHFGELKYSIGKIETTLNNHNP